MKVVLYFLCGTFLGLWVSWPGITSFKNWECLKRIINNSKTNKLSLRAALSVSPKFLLQHDSMDFSSKLRIVSDACFR